MREFQKKWLPAVLLSVATGFMLFVFAPLEIYFNNKYEFWFDFFDLFPICMLMFAIFLLASMLVLFVVSKINSGLYRKVIVLYLIGFLCTYIQGNYMVGNLPRLDGTPIEWGDYTRLRIESVFLWVIVSGIVLFAVKKLSLSKVVNLAGPIGGAVSLMLLVTVVTLGYTCDGLESKFSMRNTIEHCLEMSTDQNLVIIVLDTVDGESMSQLIEKRPDYKEVLSDFTYYNDTMAVYPFTVYAVLYLFSGEWYENQEEFIEYAKRVYRTAPLFDELEERNYRMGMYESEAYRLEESMFRFENMKDTSPEISSVIQFMKLETKLVGFKYMPFDLKRFCVTIPAEFQALEGDDKSGAYENFSSNNKNFYSYLQRTPVTLTDDKCFRFIHLEGAHSPWKYDANMNEVSQSTYEQSIEASMTIVSEYLQKLKDSGVYDNTAIMIISDHGYNIEDDESSEKRQHAILFVKGVGEQYDELQISGAPISQTDFMEAYTRLLDGKTGAEVFDYKEGDERERRYLFYEYDEYLHFYEYIQTGYAGDEETMIFTGVEIEP